MAIVKSAKLLLTDDGCEQTMFFLGPEQMFYNSNICSNVECSN